MEDRVSRPTLRDRFEKWAKRLGPGVLPLSRFVEYADREYNDPRTYFAWKAVQAFHRAGKRDGRRK